MALANKVGNYAGGQEAIGPDVEATLDSIIARVNAVTLEQQTSNNIGTDQIIDANITLVKLLAGLFTADAAGRAKFANGFVTRALQETVAKGAGAYVRYTETRSNGSNASGNPTTVTWTTRQVNTLVTDSESIGAGTPSSGVFTLPAGMYYADVACSASLQAGIPRARLRNTSEGTTALRSISTGGSQVNTDIGIRMSGQFVVTTNPSNMEIQQKVSSPGGTSTDFGRATSSGEQEDFIIADFWKIA